MTRIASGIWGAAVVFALTCFSANAPAESSEKVPVMDGGAGPCALEMTVNGPDGKPVYDATVKVHIAYGFAGIRKLDLQAGTNSNGKVKFKGLPSRVSRPPLDFQATKGDMQGTITYDPETECQATYEVTLAQAKPPAGSNQQ
jgi:hypothetical protein